MLIIRKFIGFVFVLTGFVCSQNSDGIKSLSHTIQIYYANVFSIQSNDIKLKWCGFEDSSNNARILNLSHDFVKLIAI